MKDYWKSLESHGAPGMLWVCRFSTTGRGLRLHQAPASDIVALGLKGFESPLQAVKNFVDKLPKESK